MYKIKPILFKLPEYYLLVLAILAGYSPPFYINPFFIGIAAILILQIIFKNNVSGLIFGILFFLINLYFLGALLSEFFEFPTFNAKAQKLLFIGLSIWILNMLAVLIMVYKYARNFKSSPVIKPR